MCLVLFGSSTGNAVDLSDVLVDKLRRRSSLKVTVKEFGLATLEDLQNATHIFVVCSTTGQGELPANTRPLWSQLLKRSMGSGLLAHSNLYTFGLGSSAYPKFNWAARKIHSRLLQLGATEAVPRGEGDDNGAVAYELVFDEWLSVALSHLDSDLQIIDVKPMDELLPPLNRLVPGDIVGNERSNLLNSATVVENRRITDEAHFQDVRLLELDLPESCQYEPGDVLLLYPQNEEKVVDLVIESQNWPAQLLVKPETSANVPSGGWCIPLTLRNLLLHHLDLNSIPKRQFFVIAQHFCSKPEQSERMREFATDLDDLFNYTSRPRRSIAEVILEFDSLKIPLEYILDLLPPLRPRKFSIASSPSEISPAGITRVQLAISLVKYKTMLRRVRRGLCSRYVEKLEVGRQIPVSFERANMNLMSRVGDSPMILVATGTGIAPIRSLLLSLPNISHKPILFFGCRGPTEDFLFNKELASRAEIVPAFSRHGGGYVQQQILQHPELDIENAFIYVCGSAGAMPRAVREAFVECLVKTGHANAEQIMQSKERCGMYIQETW